MRTAYVIVFLDITGPQPIAVRAGVRSSNAGSLTQIDRRLAILDVLQAPGKDYEDAERAARALIADHPAYTWIRPLMEPEFGSASR